MVSAVSSNEQRRTRLRFERAGTLLALVAMLLASGSHWVVLQSIAYGGMIIRYAQDAPLQTALAMTFDGEHPCPLCHAVQEGRQEEEEQRSELGLESRLDLALPAEAAGLPGWGGVGEDQLSPAPSRWLARVDSPPKPRPRAG